MRVFAFQGIRYTGGTGSDPGSHAAPPYDQINPRLRDELHQDELSFAQLTRPNPEAGQNPHQYAASLHSAWLADGTIREDRGTCLYPYRIDLAGGGSRLGLYALVGLEDPDSGVIRPHEQTISKTVEERLDLLRAMRTDLGPVLLLSDDGGVLDRELAQDTSGPPSATWTDLDSHQHHLFRLEEPARIALYKELLEDTPGLIADGHHRNKVAGLYAAETGATNGTAAGAKLSVITSLESEALTIDPIHRALPFELSAAQVGDAVAEVIQLTEVSTGAELAERVASAPQPALGVLRPASVELWHLDPDTGPEDLPRAASDLAVVLLHRTLLPRLGVADSASTDGTVLYRSNAQELFDLVRSEDALTGIFLPPMHPAGFAAAIAQGDVLPPKSTRFLPKVASGLVWAAHTSRLA